MSYGVVENIAVHHFYNIMEEISDIMEANVLLKKKQETCYYILHQAFI